jgi:hypothetical protein
LRACIQAWQSILVPFLCHTHAPLCQTKGEASPHCHDKRRNHSLNLSCVNEAETSVFLPFSRHCEPVIRRGNPVFCLFCATHAPLCHCEERSDVAISALLFCPSFRHCERACERGNPYDNGIKNKYNINK